jgi:CRP-like cAMP-binding protein
MTSAITTGAARDRDRGLGAAGPYPAPLGELLGAAGPEAAAIERALRDHRRAVASGATLKLEGAPAAGQYWVLSGWLAVYKSLDSGQRQIVDVALPGDMLDPACADVDVSCVEIVALTEGGVAVLPEAVLEGLRAAAPALVRHERRSHAAALSRMSERMLRLGRGSAEARIAYALVELCLRLGRVSGADCRRFHLPLTQSQLGDFTGMTAVHVCRMLARLGKSGVVTITDHIDIVVHDPAALARLAQIDPDTLRREIILPA